MGHASGTGMRPTRRTQSMPPPTIVAAARRELQPQFPRQTPAQPTAMAAVHLTLAAQPDPSSILDSPRLTWEQPPPAVQSSAARHGLLGTASGALLRRTAWGGCLHVSSTSGRSERRFPGGRSEEINPQGAPPPPGIPIGAGEPGLVKELPDRKKHR